MENAAREAIAIIKDEHQSMAAVVKGLLAHVAAARAGGEPADYHLFLAMFDYIETVPDRLHHPKEDEYLFRILRQRAREAGPVLDELETQHIEAKELLAALRRALDRFQADRDLDAFERPLKAYADFLWAHMAKEEDIVIPLAERALTDDDWRTIATAFQANRQRAAW